MAGSATGDWDRYDRWNAAIAAEFFTGRHGGRPVYLDLEDDVLWRVAAAVEGDGDDPRAELIGVVRPTLYLAPGLSIFRAHRLRLSSWKAYGRQGPPPVVAVLALLSLIAEQMTTDVDFRASNYYGRFLRTLGYSSQDPRLRQKVVRCFAEESHVLWAGLNDWLGDDPKVRGTPTAYAFDYRVHVGVPMSQALVRDADRVALHDLFADYRLSPGQPIPHTDMVRLLRDWLPQSSLSSALKTLCQHEDALLRVADVACIELAAWDGAAAMVTGGSRHRLAFVASYRRQPRPRLSLGMAVRIGDRQCRELQLESDAGPAAMDALDRSSAGCLSLAEPDDGWADVLNAGDISMAHALVAVLPLRGLDIRLRRIPRRLVVLEFDEARRRYLEVDRVRLGGDCMLLAADTLGPLLDQALDEAARPGWTRHEPGRVAGVPTGWRLYTGVTIVGITSSRQIDLGPLIPIAWTQLTLTGGLSLPARRAWLAAAPPEVSVSSLAGDPVWTVLATAPIKKTEMTPGFSRLGRTRFPRPTKRIRARTQGNPAVPTPRPMCWPPLVPGQNCWAGPIRRRSSRSVRSDSLMARIASRWFLPKERQRRSVPLSFTFSPRSRARPWTSPSRTHCRCWALPPSAQQSPTLGYVGP
jgi:hypothetical protein